MIKSPPECAANLIRFVGPDEAVRLVGDWRVECALVGEKFQANYWTSVLNALFAGVA